MQSDMAAKCLASLSDGEERWGKIRSQACSTCLAATVLTHPFLSRVLKQALVPTPFSKSRGAGGQRDRVAYPRSHGWKGDVCQVAGLQSSVSLNHQTKGIISGSAGNHSLGSGRACKWPWANPSLSLIFLTNKMGTAISSQAARRRKETQEYGGPSPRSPQHKPFMLIHLSWWEGTR